MDNPKLNTMKKIVLLLIVFAISKEGYSQDGSNLTRFTPSALLSQGQFEIQSFNNIYTQNSMRDAQGEEFNLTQRQIFLSSVFSFTYGISPASKLNVGLDVNVSRARYINGDRGNALGIFGSSNGPGDFSRTVVASIAPRIKFNPISSIPRLSLQSSLSIPVAKDLEAPFVAHDRYNWLTQFFYDKSFGSHWQLFFEVDFLYRFKNQDFQENFFRTPASIFLSYFPVPKMTFYTMIQHSPAFGRLNEGDQTDYGRLRWFSQWGLGTKYQLTDKLGIELSYTNFFASRNDGAGQTINLGLRFIK